MPASPPPIPTTRTGDGEGDGFTDLVMVLAIAGAFGIILAFEALMFVLVAFGSKP